MSQSIYDVLRNFQEAGYSLVDLIKAVDSQLALIKNSDTVKGTGDNARLLALARTHLETGLLYAEKFEQVTDSNIPLVFLEEE